jgi:hypothetical protein
MDTELISQLDALTGTRTDNITLAVQAYLSRTSSTSTNVLPNELHMQDIDTAIQAEKIRSQAELLVAKEAQIHDLQAQNGWLQHEYSRVSLIALPPPKEKGLRRLWKKKKGR